MQVLTISTDKPEVIRKKRRMHGLQARMLSDRDLAVTDAFGLRNQLIHSGPLEDDLEALPVPTTLLVSSSGEVLWMDLADNYQRRSGPEVVLVALETHLNAPKRVRRSLKE